MGIVGKMGMVGKRCNTQNTHKTLPNTLSLLLLPTPFFLAPIC